MSFAKADPIKVLFEKVDGNKDGALDIDELCSLFSKGEHGLTGDDLRLLYEHMDKNGDGRIEFQEFVQWLQTSPEAQSLLKSSTPGPGTYNPEKQRRQSAGTMSRARRDADCRRASSVPTPGPGDYVGDDRHEAHHKRFPSATIGRGPGHRSASMTNLNVSSSSPGPGAYSVDMGTFARRRRGSGASEYMGSGSGHQTPELSREGSPGPGAYTWDDRQQSHHWHVPKATIGRGPGHVNPSATMGNLWAAVPLSREGSPGPADYTTFRPRRTHGGTFGRAEGHTWAGGWAHHDAVVQERRTFNVADRNKDGKLDLQEVCTILWRGNPDMKQAEIEMLFNSVDRNKDGRIDFSELVDFIHSSRGSSKRSKEKIKEAFLAGPASKPGLVSSVPKGAWNGARGGSLSRTNRF